MGFQSLYTGATGLISHGTKMQAIGNNLANVQTLGFKGADVRFENLLSKTVTGGDNSVRGLNQVGLGAAIAAIQGDFRQGAIEPGTYATDLAIGGKGYFQVVKDGLTHYTRAGNFRFDSLGYLRDPNGFVLQGQMISDTGMATGDLQLELNENNQVTTEAQATSLATMAMNLNTGADRTSSAANPFFALMQSWNGGGDPPLSDGAYDYVNSIVIYDDQGTAHELNVYFDGVRTSGSSGEQYVEFVAGVSPDEDGRADFAGTSGAGLLMTGVLTFTAAGQLVNVAAYTPGDPLASGAKSLSSWVPATIGEDGVPLIEAEFAAASSGAAQGVISMGLDMGLTTESTAWGAASASNASAVGTSASALASMQSPERAALATTAYTGNAATIYQTQDGYGTGVLKSMAVNREGIMEGTFSNGVVKDLFQITLYTFPSEYGLRREGMNHFSETLASGSAVEGLPDQEQFGYLMGQSLEQSNVDMARQFSDMIVTERGFQANSKIITTTDTILQTLVNLKR